MASMMALLMGDGDSPEKEPPPGGVEVCATENATLTGKHAARGAAPPDSPPPLFSLLLRCVSTGDGGGRPPRTRRAWLSALPWPRPL